MSSRSSDGVTSCIALAAGREPAGPPFRLARRAEARARDRRAKRLGGLGRRHDDPVPGVFCKKQRAIKKGVHLGRPLGGDAGHLDRFYVMLGEMLGERAREAADLAGQGHDYLVPVLQNQTGAGRACGDLEP